MQNGKSFKNLSDLIQLIKMHYRPILKNVVVKQCERRKIESWNCWKNKKVEWWMWVIFTFYLKSVYYTTNWDWFTFYSEKNLYGDRLHIHHTLIVLLVLVWNDFGSLNVFFVPSFLIHGVSWHNSHFYFYHFISFHKNIYFPCVFMNGSSIIHRTSSSIDLGWYGTIPTLALFRRRNWTVTRGSICSLTRKGN